MKEKLLLAPRPLARIGFRYLFRHPWQSALMVLGIALGVAVIVAIDLANNAASRAFDLSTDAITGKATHQIIGGPVGLDETIYTTLRVSGRVPYAAPIISDYITSSQLGSRPLQLLGVDPFAEAPFRAYLIPAKATGGGLPGDEATANLGALIPFLTRPGALLISEGLAQEYGVAVGERLVLDIGGRQSSGVIVGLLSPADALSRRALDGLILADIATAQEITGRLGKLDHVDLILPAATADCAPDSRSQRPGCLADIQARLPADAQIVPVIARSGALSQMTAAFRTNLTALSLLALVVGMLLIYNSMTFSVVQRRALFGALRCLGVTRNEIGGLVLTEAALIGAIGSALGLGLGVLLGRGAVRLVTQTINDLYFVVTVRGVDIPLLSLAKGMLVGITATVISAAFPAWEAASVPPRLALARSGIEDRARRAVPITAMAGGGGLLIGGGLLAIPPTFPATLLRTDPVAGAAASLVLSFAGIFFVTIGFALLAPAVTLITMRGAVKPASKLFGVLGRLAPRSITGALSRTTVAIAALMVAISVTIGVGLMVSSFRTTVVTWLGQTLWGDVYISAPGLTATRAARPLDPQVVTIARSWPGIIRADVLRSADVSSPVGQIAVAAVSDRDFTAPRIFVSTDGSRAEAAAAVTQGAVLASEPLANRLGLPSHGAHVTLFTDRGPRAFPVAGIYRDYSSSQGVVMMSLDLYRAYWDDPTVTAIALNLTPDVDTDGVVKGLMARLAEISGSGALVRPNAALRSEALAVFDRAFAITGALQTLAAIVAFIGVLSALLSLQLERTRELGVLRAIGLTVRQMRGAVLLETGLMGAVAGLLAMPTGLTLALILIYIINRRSFGWTLEFHAQPAIFIEALILAVAAALLAGIYPAIRMGRMLAAEALRGE